MPDEASRRAPQLSAEEVERVQFPQRPRGYDRRKVDRFLTMVADELRRLTDSLARYEDEGDEPFKRLGTEAGKFLQSARRSADEILEDAQTRADAFRKEVDIEVAAAREEAARFKAAAETKADHVVRKAEADAARVRHEADRVRSRVDVEIAEFNAAARTKAEHLRRLAEVEGAVLVREAQAEAAQIHKDAKKHAQEIRDAAEREATELVRRARTEVRRLMQLEAELTVRIGRLTGQLATPDQERARRAMSGTPPPS